MKIDKNDAPEGAIAVDAKNGCIGCLYYDGGVGCFVLRPDGKCRPDERRDGHDVIFKPAPKAYQRDAHGRFTSEQAEKTKQLKGYAKHMMRVASTGIDLPPRGFGKTETTTQILESAIRHTPYTDVKKAIEDETITQTLGKKQAEAERKREFNYAKSIAVSLHEKHFQECTEWEPCADTIGLLTQIDNMTTGWECEIESNAKHVQTNEEKYADKPVPEMAKLWVRATKGDATSTAELDKSTRSLVHWLNQPAAQDWPEWCKVGAWIAWNFKDSPTEFFKIDREANGVMYYGRGVITKEDTRWFKPARVRQFTAKEAVDLFDKKIVVEGFNLKFDVTEVVFTKNGCRVHRSPDACYTLGFLADNATFEDGSPCGVLEVVE